MEQSALATNIVLAILTGVYVILTGWLVLEARRTNRLQRETFERQIRITTLPHLFCALHRGAKGLELTISNAGQNPGFDVDVMIIADLFEEETDREEFVSRWVVPEYQSKINPPSNGEFGVFDRLTYPVFPPGRKVASVLGFPHDPDSLHLLLQFRDVLGTNYAQVFWFIAPPTAAMGSAFRLADLKPTTLSSVVRATYGGPEGWQLRTREAEQQLPEFLRDFAEVWRSSIPVGYTRIGLQWVEDRGDWSAI